MKKEEVRKEFFKLRIKHHSYKQCRKILLAQFSYEISIRTLKRWSKKLNGNEWDLKDKSKDRRQFIIKLILKLKKMLFQ